MDDRDQQWERLARRTAVRLRAGAVLHSSLPVTIVAGLGLLGLGIAGRLFDWAWMGSLPVIVAGAVVMVVAGVAVAVLYGNREPVMAGFARLDCTLGLNNALTSAAAGRGKWPPLPENSDDLLRFNWKRILPPYVMGLLLAASGFLIPLPDAVAGAGRIPPPRAHEALAALISELEKVEALKQGDVQRLQQQLDEIRNQPAENWYSHGSLEAADHLQSGITEQLRTLERGLSRAGSSLASLANADESMSAAEQQRLAGDFKAALQAMKSASPGLNEKLMESLSAIDPASLKSLDSNQLKEVMQQLETAAQACRDCQGQGGAGKNNGAGNAQNELDELLGRGDGSGQGRQDGAGTGQPGSGGINRGPGVASLPLSRTPADLATNNPETIQSGDLRHARPGDAIGSADTEHKLDRTSTGLQPGGESAAGQGGEAVSKDALLPSEKAVLRSYFR